MSASTGAGLDDLRRALIDRHRSDDQGHQLVVTNLRHFEALTAAKAVVAGRA